MSMQNLGLVAWFLAYLFGAFFRQIKNTKTKNIAQIEVGMMTVNWPKDLQALFSVCQFLLLDIDSYGFSCIAGTGTWTPHFGEFDTKKC